MTAPRRILFFTNSDYGQANVVLATAHELLHRAPDDVEIHIASFHALREAVQKTSDFALKTAPRGSNKARKPLIFHGMDGISWGPAVFRPENNVAAAQDLPPNLVNSAKVVLKVPTIMLPQSPDEFMVIYRESQRVLEEVKPDLVVPEPLATAPLTLLTHVKFPNWVVLSPNTIKDVAVPSQPRLAMLWKYPLVSSAMPFPLPWSLIPKNIALCLVAGYAVLTDTRIKTATARLRSELGDPAAVITTANELGVLKPPPPGLHILVANSPDIDYPFDVLPPHLVPCGPIVRAAAAVADVDAGLAAWLRRGPTLYVNLGTQVKATPSETVEMALAFRDVLDRWDKQQAAGGEEGDEPGGGALQILWKLGRKPGADGLRPKENVYEGEWKAVVDVLRPEVEADRVRVTDWVTAEPKSVLESGHVICSVNHGGASSFNEAICSGIPQVLLPPWTDTYDFANRVELLGVGRWANQKAKPRWARAELASCLAEVLLGPRSGAIRARAREVAARHPEAAGREKAAAEILARLG